MDNSEIKFKFYMQQTILNAATETYTKINFVELYETFGVVCKESTYENSPFAKKALEENWPGEDGVSVYLPRQMKLDAYDQSIIFAIKGTEQEVLTNLRNFFNYLYGRNENGSCRLAFYDESTSIGRKDVYVTKVANNIWWNESYDDEKLAEFKVTFRICDPATNVTLGTNELTW